MVDVWSRDLSYPARAVPVAVSVLLSQCKNLRNFAGFRQITHSFFTGNSVPMHPQFKEDESVCAEPQMCSLEQLLSAGAGRAFLLPCSYSQPQDRLLWVSPWWSDTFQRS